MHQQDPYRNGANVQYPGNVWASLRFDTPFQYTGGAILVKMCFNPRTDLAFGAETYT